jgi:hypothetical protein
VGLTPDAARLAAPPPPEAFINHLDDHDFVLMGPALTEAEATLDRALGNDAWRRDEVLASGGELSFYIQLERNKRAGLLKSTRPAVR